MTKLIAAPFWWMTGLIFGHRSLGPEPRIPTVPYFGESLLTEDMVNNRPGAVIRVRRPSIIIETAGWITPP